MPSSAKMQRALKGVTSRANTYVLPAGRRQSADARAQAERIANLRFAESVHAGPESLRKLAAEYVPAQDLFLDGDGRIPLFWWTVAENYGDILSPYLVRRMTGRSVRLTDGRTPNYSAIGSIVRNVNRKTVVWGSGLMGHENKWRIPHAARYAAVRGPTTRSVLQNLGYDVPEIYGDPALLLPIYFWPEVEQTHEVGLVVRWSESRWRNIEVGDGVKVINFGSGDIEAVTRELLSCRRVASSSLHGLVVADAYGIPSSWIRSDGAAGGSRPGGGQFKFFDYFNSVWKQRAPQDLPSEGILDSERLLATLTFDDSPIRFDHKALLDACPMLEPKK